MKLIKRIIMWDSENVKTFLKQYSNTNNNPLLKMNFVLTTELCANYLGGNRSLTKTYFIKHIGVQTNRTRRINKKLMVKC